MDIGRIFWYVMTLLAAENLRRAGQLAAERASADNEMKQRFVPGEEDVGVSPSILDRAEPPRERRAVLQRLELRLGERLALDSKLPLTDGVQIGAISVLSASAGTVPLPHRPTSDLGSRAAIVESGTRASARSPAPHRSRYSSLAGPTHEGMSHQSESSFR